MVWGAGGEGKALCCSIFRFPSPSSLPPPPPSNYWRVGILLGACIHRSGHLSQSAGVWSAELDLHTAGSFELFLSFDYAPDDGPFPEVHQYRTAFLVDPVLAINGRFVDRGGCVFCEPWPSSSLRQY